MNRCENDAYMILEEECCKCCQWRWVRESKEVVCGRGGNWRTVVYSIGAWISKKKSESRVCLETPLSRSPTQTDTYSPLHNRGKITLHLHYSTALHLRPAWGLSLSPHTHLFPSLNPPPPPPLPPLTPIFRFFSFFLSISLASSIVLVTAY